VSSIGDWLYLVALVVLVYQETGDPVLLGIVGAARLIPYLVLSIPAGLITDRFDRRMVLLVSDLARAACMVVMAGLLMSGSGVWPVAVVAIVAACFSTFFYPAMGALLPSLARDESEFGPANSLWATLDNLAWVIGPGIAGLILAAGSIEMAFLLNAVSFGLIAVILWTLPKSARSTMSESETGAPGAASASEPERKFLWFRIPASIDLRAIAGVLVLDITGWLVFGGIGILIVVFALDVFKGGEEATGLLSAAVGVGGIIGAVLSGVLVLRPRLAPPLIVAGIAYAGATVLLGVAPGIAIAFLAIAVASVGNLVLDVTRTTIFQRVVPDAYRGRFGGLLMTTQAGSEAVGTLVVPILAAGLGIAVVFGGLGVAVIATTVLAVALIGRAADTAAGPFDADLRRIARLPLFGGLSAARIESALRRLEPIRVEAGAAIVRQGEPADRFYVIGEGSFAVTRSEVPGEPERRIRTLGRFDVFGERGLIARTPRTATVTATEPGLLFAMDAADFLSLVGGRRGMAERFLALYDSPAASPDSLTAAG
jgi:MFS family permease